MEIKGILEKIRANKEKEKEFFLALQLEEGLVRSAVWEVEQGQVKISAIGEQGSWSTEEGLLEAIDISLPPQETKARRAIFGVTPEWVSGNEITQEKLQLLKKAAQELDFSPLGFVIIPEAIIHLLKTNEGIPPTAVIGGLGKQKLTVVLVKLGKIIGTQIVNRSENLGADLAEGLSRFIQEETFPPRVILYNQGEKLEEEKQQLVDFSWSEEKINFLHLPKVEVLPDDFIIRAIALAGGREAAAAQGIVSGEVKPKQELVEVGKAIDSEGEKMGFFKGEDVAERQVSLPVQQEDTQAEKKPQKLIKALFNFLPKLKIKIKPVALKNFIPRRFTLTFGLVGIIFIGILGGLGALWWYLPSAKVVLFIKSQPLEKDFQMVLPSQKVEVDSEEEKSISTTGTKLIGEPAKGEVTIYNRTAIEKTFSSGAEITGVNNLKFTLDEEVKVASESAGSDYTTIPGKAKVKVTAKAIGSEGNLAAGAEFTIANFSKSDYVAKNEEAFSQGTSREVQVVAKKDQEKLLEDLTGVLKEKALPELESKLNPGTSLVNESLDYAVEEKVFDKKVDEEANQLELKLKLRFSALSYSESEFKKFTAEEIRKAVPQGFEYKEEESEFSFKLDKINTEGAAIFQVHFKANLFPVLDLAAIKNNLIGKSPQIGTDYLDSLPEVESLEAEFSPHLPAKMVTFPRSAQRITIEIKKK